MSDPRDAATPRTSASDGERVREIADWVARTDAHGFDDVDVIDALDHLSWLLRHVAAVEGMNHRQLGALSMQHQIRETRYEEQVASLTASLEAAKADAAWWEAELRDTLRAVTAECNVDGVKAITTLALELRKKAGRQDRAALPSGDAPT